MPKFTILLPTHDHADTLMWSVASVQAQTRQDFEIFIIGDGVPDRTREIVCALQQNDSRIRFFDFSKGPNRGELHRHQVLHEAGGELICYQCDDDLWLPEHLETLEQLLANHDLAHTMQLEIHPGQATPATWFFNAALPTEVQRLKRNETGFGTATAGHTAKAYWALPVGWRTTPPGLHTDLYMWSQFLDQPWCRAFSLPRPTVVRFPSPSHKGWTTAQRCAELARWSARLASPTERLKLTHAALEPLCEKTYAEGLESKRLSVLLAGALEALHAQAPPFTSKNGLEGKSVPLYMPGTPLSFHEGGTGSAYLAYGFSRPESWGVWSEERSAAIVLPLENRFSCDADLTVDHRAFLVKDHHEQVRIFLSVNRSAVDNWMVNLGPSSLSRRVRLPATCLKGLAYITIHFRLEKPCRPVDAGLSTDSRLLGLGLTGLCLAPAA